MEGGSAPYPGLHLSYDFEQIVTGLILHECQRASMKQNALTKI